MRIKNHFPINNFALSLAWKRSHGATRKRPIARVTSTYTSSHALLIAILSRLRVRMASVVWNCSMGLFWGCYRLLLHGCAGNEDKICPPKQSHSAIQHSVAPLSSATSDFEKDSCTSTWMGSFLSNVLLHNVKGAVETRHTATLLLQSRYIPQMLS